MQVPDCLLPVHSVSSPLQSVCEPGGQLCLRTEIARGPGPGEGLAKTSGKPDSACRLCAKRGWQGETWTCRHLQSSEGDRGGCAGTDGRNTGSRLESAWWREKRRVREAGSASGAGEGQGRGEQYGVGGWEGAGGEAPDARASEDSSRVPTRLGVKKVQCMCLWVRVRQQAHDWEGEGHAQGLVVYKHVKGSGLSMAGTKCPASRCRLSSCGVVPAVEV